MAVIDFLDRGASISPDRPYLIAGDQSFTYREVQAVTYRIGQGLLSLGLPPETPAAVWAPNDPVAWQCALGIWRAGFAWVPVNARNPAEENALQLHDFDCAALFFHSALSVDIAQLIQRLPKLQLLVCIDGEVPNVPGAVALETWSARFPAEPPSVVHAMEQVCAITPTGGTTGLPKGVMNTHRSFQTMVANWLSVLAYPGGERPVNLAAAPLTHTAGVFSFMATLRGGTIVILPRPDPVALLDTIEQRRITEIFLPPTAIYSLLDTPGVEKRDYSSLRYLLYGAAPMSPAKLRRALQVFGPVLIQGFGQSEAPAGISCLEPADHFKDGKIADEGRLSSCGRVFPFTAMRILDDSGAPCASGEIGEICVSGDIVMKGYYRDPDRTREAISDGWLRTGDLGFIDPEGFLHITDRKKDVIISGGFNVFSTEVEAVIREMEGVQDCAVIGVPHERWGEAVAAVLQLRPGAAVTKEEVIALCKSRIGSVRSPKIVAFVPDLPRSGAGKILKRELREMLKREPSRIESGS